MFYEPSRLVSFVPMDEKIGLIFKDSIGNNNIFRGSTKPDLSF